MGVAFQKPQTPLTHCDRQTIMGVQNSMLMLGGALALVTLASCVVSLKGAVAKTGTFFAGLVILGTIGTTMASQTLTSLEPKSGGGITPAPDSVAASRAGGKAA